ncbi:MAG: aminotransferase class IV [Planctomycetales bacterium]|nr:aminotransferase class IV [Planctomycetales bacterium]
MSLQQDGVQQLPANVSNPSLKTVPVSIWMNGRATAPEQATVSIFDRGYLYGDGVFDTIAAWEGRIIWLEEHIDRFLAGCDRLQIPVPYSRNELIEAVHQTFDRYEGNNGRIRVSASRGIGGTAIYDQIETGPTVVIWVKPLELYPERFYRVGMRLKSFTTERHEAAVKHLSFLVSVACMMDARREGFDDAFFVDTDGNVSEGATFNIFSVYGNQVTTPARKILNGVTRAKVLDLIRQTQHQVNIEDLPLTRLLEADEVFITGSTKKIVPVSEIDGHTIGRGIVGTVTRELTQMFNDQYF